MQTVENIKAILSEQVIGYRALLDVLRQESKYIVHFNAPRVEALSKEKDSIVLKLRLLVTRLIKHRTRSPWPIPTWARE